MRSYGEASVLREESVPDPATRPGHVLVRLVLGASAGEQAILDVRPFYFGQPYGGGDQALLIWSDL